MEEQKAISQSAQKKKKQNDKKKKKALRASRRHKFLYGLVFAPVRLFYRLRYGFVADRTGAPDCACLILSNHDSDLNMLMTPASFRRMPYIVASEHIFRSGWVSKLLIWAFDPIPRQKGTTDGACAFRIIKTLRGGDSVLIFAEGQSTFTGVTLPIHPTIAGMVRAAKVPLVTYRLELGYMARPRWCKMHRKGDCRGKVVHVYSVDDIKAMSDEEIAQAVRDDLYFDAFAYQKAALEAGTASRFRGKRRAEYLERALYTCPCCKSLCTLKSSDNDFICEKCSFCLTVNEYGLFSPAADGKALPFDDIKSWDDWQKEELRLRIESLGDDEPIFRDEAQILIEISPEHTISEAERGTLTLTKTALTIGKRVFPLEELGELAMCGPQNIDFSYDNQNYELRSENIRSGLKYIEAFEIIKQ